MAKVSYRSRSPKLSLGVVFLNLSHAGEKRISVQNVFLILPPVEPAIAKSDGKRVVAWKGTFDYSDFQPPKGR